MNMLFLFSNKTARTTNLKRIIPTQFFILISTLISTSSPATGQDTSDYKAEVRALAALVRETPSYKAQIDSFGHDKYEKLYQEVLKANHPSASFQEFLALSQLVLPFRDNHIYFSENPTRGPSVQQVQDTAFVRNYRRSASFRRLPVLKWNLDSLQKVMNTKHLDSIEGIYFMPAMKIAIVRDGIYGTFNKYTGIVLETAIGTWVPGEVAVVLHEYKPFNFRAYHSDIVSRTYLLLKNERYVNHKLSASGWKKINAGKNFSDLPGDAAVFEFKQITDSIQYIRLGNFDAHAKNIATINKFYDSVKNKLTAPALIVDLRNNPGGAFRASGHFLRLLGTYAERGRIFGLINNKTVSNAEQFTLRMRSFPRVTLLGQTTNGTLSYGNNNGTTAMLPGGRYRLYITDMADDGKYLPFEERGLNPNVFLKNDRDWLQQTIEYIED